jgi:hypothetical protein
MWLLSIPSLRSAAELLSAGPRNLPFDIKVSFSEGAIRIAHVNQPVFHMKVKLIGQALDVDYPKTTEGHGGAGWGHLGMVLALLYGQAKGCTQVTVNTPSELTAAAIKYWSRYKLNAGSNTGKAIGQVLAAALAFKSSTDQAGVSYLHVNLS